MNPRIPRRLVPEPAGFDDDVKRKAAHAERAWDGATGLFSASGAAATAAAAAGLAVPPVAAVLGALAAVSFLFQKRSKWAKDDPPRADYHDSATIRPRQIDPFVLITEERFLTSASLVALLETGARRVEATVVSLEKAMGAEEEGRRFVDRRSSQMAALRRSEAHHHARLAGPVLVAVEQAANGLAFLLTELESARWPEVSNGTLLEALDEGTLGRLIAAGVDPSDLAIPLQTNSFPPGTALGTLMEAGSAAAEFGRALSRWGSEGGEQMAQRLSPYDPSDPLSVLSSFGRGIGPSAPSAPPISEGES